MKVDGRFVRARSPVYGRPFVRAVDACFYPERRSPGLDGERSWTPRTGPFANAFPRSRRSFTVDDRTDRSRTSRRYTTCTGTNSVRPVEVDEELTGIVEGATAGLSGSDGRSPPSRRRSTVNVSGPARGSTVVIDVRPGDRQLLRDGTFVSWMKIFDQLSIRTRAFIRHGRNFW